MRFLKLLLILLIPFFIISCTKNRKPRLPEKVEYSLFSIAELEALDFKLKLAQTEIVSKNKKLKTEFDKKNLQPTTNKNQKQVKSHNANEKTAFLFQNLKLHQADQDILVKLKVTKEYLTAYKVIKKTAAKANVTEIDLTIAKTMNDSIWIPLFKFRIDSYGTVQQSKNSNGHKTMVLELKRSAWSAATHVVIDPVPENRLMVDLANQPYEELEEIYSLEKINNRIFTRKELQDYFSFDFSMLALYPLDTPFVVRINGSQLQIKLMASPSSSWITDIEKKNIAHFESCNSKAVADANVGHAPAPTDCVLLDRGNTDITYIKPKLKITSDNTDTTHEIEFAKVPLTSKSNFIKIEKNKIIKPQELLKEFSDLVAIKNIDKTEFLFRRTIEDASNSLIVGTGESGAVEIVKFVFSNDKVTIRRVDAALSSTYTKEVDTEELMVFPAKYYQLTKRDEKGVLLTTPQLINTDKKNAEFVKIDFEHNKIPISSSPLMYLEGGSCFSSINNSEIKDEDLDNNLNSGILNFSYSYSVSLIPDCMNSYSTVSNYWDSAFAQMTHNAKERISIVKYNPRSVTNYQIPFYAQRKLKFGAFTMANRKYDQYGQYGDDGTEESFPLQFDISNGKKIVYILGGVSANNPRRELITKVAREVINDWNTAFRKALQGSSLERTDDIIELKIDGVDADPGHLGDLNKNYIWIVEKRIEGAPSGVARPAVNPRTGVVESANVIMYDAEFLDHAGYRYESEKKFKKFDDLFTKLILKKKNELNDESQNLLNEHSGSTLKTNAKIEIDQTAKPNATIQINSDSINTNDRKKTMESIISFYDNIHKQETSTAAAHFRSTSEGLKEDIAQITNTNAKSISPTAELAWDKIANKNIITEIYNKIDKADAWENNTAIEVIANEAFLNQNKQLLSTEQKNTLSNKIAKMKLRSQLRQNIQASSPTCAAVMPDEFLNISSISSVDDFYLNSYRLLLSHELGHSFGLTHNFIGSADQENYQDRAYSSIMDYPDGSKVLYNGIGSYDIHALRAIYTQRLENQDGSLIGLDEILKNSKAKSWTAFMSLSDEKIAELKLKPYHYCSDYDLGSDLKCQRWDFGATATEIIQHDIKKYMRMYQLINGSNNRLDYNWLNSGRYIKVVIESLRPFRKVLNDYISKVLESDNENEKSEQIKSDYRDAANLAYMYLLSIVGTPTTDLPFESEERFSVISKIISPDKYKDIDPKFTYMIKEAKVDKNGVNTIVDTPVSLHLVEAKSMSDQFVAANDYRLNTRGFYYDKAFAQMFLISRQSIKNKFRPSQASALEFSFIEFEKYGLVEKPMILDSLVDTLKGNNKPATFDFHGGLVLISDDNYKTTTSPLTSSAALSFAIFDLAPSSADALSGVNNYLFRIGVREGSHPQGMLSVNRLEEEKDSTSGYHYYQTTGATLTNKFIEELYIKREFLEAPKEIIQIVANGATLLLDLAIDFDGAGLLKTSVFSEKNLTELLKKYPDNQKIKSTIQYFDNNTETFKHFLATTLANQKLINIARDNLESLANSTALELYGSLEIMYKIKEIQFKIDKLGTDQTAKKEKEELEDQLFTLQNRLKVSQDLTAKFEVRIDYYIIARRALNFILTSGYDLNKATDAIQRYQLKNLFVQAAADVWVNDYRKQNPKATDAEVKQALLKNDEESLYLAGKEALDKKSIDEFEASKAEIKTKALANFIEVEKAFSEDTSKFKSSWNAQFKKIQQLSNYFQLYTIEAQK